MPAAIRLSKGARRHIRNEKADIRRRFGNSLEAEGKIKELIQSFYQGAKEAKLEKPAVPEEIKSAKAAKKLAK